MRAKFADSPLPALKSFRGLSSGKFKFSTPEVGVEAKVKFTNDQLAKYQRDLVGYCRSVLGVEPWSGGDKPGQLELFEDISESVRNQLDGLPHCKIFHIEAGHGVGKTFGAAAIVNWFHDCFRSIVITTAPTDDQVRLLLWKDIKTQRKDKGLPGKVLPEDPRMSKAEDWFAIGRTTSDAGGKGTARMQGQHPSYWLYVLDEAEGVPEFVYGAVNGMTTGGLVGLVIMQGNPQTRTSRFHKESKRNGVKKYRLSCLNHPNVISGKPLVPGAVIREWCIQNIVEGCEIVREPNEDEYTFSVPYEVVDEVRAIVHPVGTIFRPSADFCFRVLGVAPANVADSVFVAPGRFEAAVNRVLGEHEQDPDICQIGVDCARFGKDAGTVYVLHKNVAYRDGQVFQGDTNAYVEAIKDAAIECHELGARKLSIRVDGSGGYGAGTIDALKADEQLRVMFSEMFVVHEVQFGSTAHAEEKYADKATEMYAEAAETILGISIEVPPGDNRLEVDLTERQFEWINRQGKTLRKLHDKEKFRKKYKRSPDDGDGFVLAVAPEFIFDTEPISHSPGLGERPRVSTEIYRPPSMGDLDRYRPPGMR